MYEKKQYPPGVHDILRGRPPRYREEYPDLLIDYFAIDPIIKDEDGNESVADLPTLAGFCSSIGVPRSILFDWLKLRKHKFKTQDDGTKIKEDAGPKYPKLNIAFGLIRDYQEHILITNTTKGRYNAMFSGLVAKNLLDWKDKSEQVTQLTGAEGGPVQSVVTVDMDADTAARKYAALMKKDHD
jgi:hypothetical protein